MVKSKGIIQFPIGRVHIEITNYCNFNCSFCPNQILKRKRQHMDFSLFKKIIDEISEKKIVDKIHFHLMGEPFLYPKFFEALQYGIDKGQKIIITTNAALLTDKKLEKLSSIRFDELRISYTTPGQDAFNLRKSMLTYDQFHSIVLNVIKEFFKKNNQTPIVLKFVYNGGRPLLKWLMKNYQIIEDDKKLRHFLVKLSIDLHNILKNEDNYDLKKVIKIIKNWDFNKVKTLVLSPRISFLVNSYPTNWGNMFEKKKIHKAKFGYCNTLRSQFAIISNGDLLLCCQDFEGRTAMGNVKKQSIEEILKSEQAIAIRKNFDRFRVIHPVCKICFGADSVMKSYINQIVRSLARFNKLKKKFLFKTKNVD